MKWWGEGLGRGASAQLSRVAPHASRDWLLLARSTAVHGPERALLYWRQQSDDRAHRPLHALYEGVEPQWSWVCRNLRCERLLVRTG
ncbi:hypothetical protein SFRURICE_015132 [Spodoptera frugiperda]|nr:hypothetical protein SFRURICE_015132 [Spodoptera frugiperda]